MDRDSTPPTPERALALLTWLQDRGHPGEMVRTHEDGEDLYYVKLNRYSIQEVTEEPWIQFAALRQVRSGDRGLLAAVGRKEDARVVGRKVTQGNKEMDTAMDSDTRAEKMELEKEMDLQDELGGYQEPNDAPRQTTRVKITREHDIHMQDEFAEANPPTENKPPTKPTKQELKDDPDRPWRTYGIPFPEEPVKHLSTYVSSLGIEQKHPTGKSILSLPRRIRRPPTTIRLGPYTAALENSRIPSTSTDTEIQVPRSPSPPQTQLERTRWSNTPEPLPKTPEKQMEFIDLTCSPLLPVTRTPAVEEDSDQEVDIDVLLATLAEEADAIAATPTWELSPVHKYRSRTPVSAQQRGEEMLWSSPVQGVFWTDLTPMRRVADSGGMGVGERGVRVEERAGGAKRKYPIGGLEGGGVVAMGEGKRMRWGV